MRSRAALAGILLLAGCSLAPVHEPPPPAIPGTYPESPPTDVDAVRAPELAWNAFFRDPALRDCIAAALANNQDLAAATARIAQAQAQFRVQQSQRLPGLDAGGSAQRSGTPTAAGRITGDSRALQVAIPSFELDFWGRVANLSESARRQYLATAEAREAFRLSLIASVAATYYTIRASEEGVALAGRTLDSRQQTLELSQLRMEAGLTSAVVRDQAHSLVNQAQTQQAQLQRARAFALNRLRLLLGGPLPESLQQGMSVADAAQLAPFRAGLPSELLVDRPDIRAAEHRLRAANANIGAARALYLPRIALTGAGGHASDELSGLFSSGNRVWSFGLGAALPLFDWGRRKAAVGMASAERDEREAQYQSTVQNAFREVADGLDALRYNHEQIEALRQTVQVQSNLAEIAQARYEVGLSPYLEVLDAERNLFAARQSLLQLQAADLQDRVGLYIALGGGGM